MTGTSGPTDATAAGRATRADGGAGTSRATVPRPERIRLTARLLVEDGGRLLLARSLEWGNRFLPGGEVEPGEAAAHAGAREFEEETGIARDHLRVGPALGVLEHSWVEGGRVLHQVDVVQHAAVAGISAGDPVPSREPHLAFEWWAVDALAGADLFPRAYLTLLPEWRARGPAAFATDMAAPRAG